MKSTTFVATIAVLAAVFSVAANAQTGRPSTAETRSSADSPRLVAGDQELGSYGRYLMLNGATRDEAVVAARNVDHPSAHHVVASRGRARTDAPAPARQ